MFLNNPKLSKSTEQSDVFLPCLTTQKRSKNPGCWLHQGEVAQSMIFDMRLSRIASCSCSSNNIVHPTSMDCADAARWSRF